MHTPNFHSCLFLPTVSQSISQYSLQTWQIPLLAPDILLPPNHFYSFIFLSYCIKFSIDHSQAQQVGKCNCAFPDQSPIYQQPAPGSFFPRIWPFLQALHCSVSECLPHSHLLCFSCHGYNTSLTSRLPFPHWKFSITET